MKLISLRHTLWLSTLLGAGLTGACGSTPADDDEQPADEGTGGLGGGDGSGGGATDAGSGGTDAGSGGSKPALECEELEAACNGECIAVGERAGNCAYLDRAQMTELAVEGDVIYASNGSWVNKFTLADPTMVEISPEGATFGNDYGDFLVSDGVLYFMPGSAFAHDLISLTPGDELPYTSAVLATGLDYGDDIHLMGDNLYWRTDDNFFGGGEIDMVAKTGGTPAAVNSATEASGFAADEERLYWVDATNAEDFGWEVGPILSATWAAPDTTTELVPLISASEIMASPSRLYWRAGGTTNSVASIQIMSVAKTGGTVTTLYDANHETTLLVVDDQGAFIAVNDVGVLRVELDGTTELVADLNWVDAGILVDGHLIVSNSKGLFSLTWPK